MDDEFWSQYQKECVFQSASVPVGLPVYDEACCYDSVFNGFEVYQRAEGDAYVNVY